MMPKFHRIATALTLCLISVVISASLLFSQEQVKDSLFREASTLLEDAKKVEAGLYAPTYFQQGFDLYNKADVEFKEGKKLESIRKKLTEAAVQLKKSIEITRLSRLTLDEITQSRNAALEQSAPDWSPDLFQNAESTFRKAAEKVEAGKTEDAKQIAVQGSKLYRDAELAAIKNRILNDTWAALKSCQEQEGNKYAPVSFALAQSLANNAETVLTNNRYDQEKATALALDATYEARHALFLATVILQLRNKDSDIENYLLDVENQFKHIAATLNMSLEFDGGFQGPADKISEAIAQLVETNAAQKNKIEELTKTVDDLSTELENLKTGQLKELTGKLSELEKVVQAERTAKEQFNRVEQMFTPSEAKVIKESDNVIIRLYGINFPSGKAIIHPEYFPLLTKVIKAIEIYPASYIRLEGHTDSKGSNVINEKLSADRANSVVQYILANSSVDPNKITGVGYGEDRPVATNDTEEGRALNRRIDVVITPIK